MENVINGKRKMENGKRKSEKGFYAVGSDPVFRATVRAAFL